MYTRYIQDDGNGCVHNTVDPFMRSLPVFLSDEQAMEYFSEEKA